MKRRPQLHPPAAKRRSRRAAISMEYMLILALVVLPLGLMIPFFIRLIQQYSERMAFTMRLPFP